MQSLDKMETLTFFGIPIEFDDALPNDILELRDPKTGKILARMYTGNQECDLMRWEDDGGRTID